jgi:hypothetical protein
MFVHTSLPLGARLTFSQDKRFEIQQKTTFEEFLALMQNDRRTANIDRDALLLIFERVSLKLMCSIPSC